MLSQSTKPVAHQDQVGGALDGPCSSDLDLHLVVIGDSELGVGMADAL